MQQRQRKSIQAIVALFCWVSLAHGQDALTARWDGVYAEIGEEISVRRKEGAKWSSYIQSNPQDAHPLIWPSDKHQCDVIVRRTEALLAAVKPMPTTPDMGALEQELAMLKSKIASQGNQPGLFREVCSVRRRIALSLPLLPDTLLFCGFAPHANIFQGAHQAATAVAHPKAGIYMATGIRSGTPSFKDFLERKTVTNGPYKDKVLSNKNASWEGKALFSGLALDYDGSRLAFAWAEASELGEEEGYHAVLRKTTRDTFHVYWTTLNGSEIYNVATHRDFDQYDPCWLPNGRIVYMSDERNAQERCGGRLPSGALFSVKADGSDPVQLSWHETNERYPSVDNEGRLVYSRWDYVDRSLYSAHNMWICYPDGRDPRAPHGNYRKHPNSTLPDKDIPISESGIKAIPGTSGKYAAVSSNHHFAHRGHLIVIDVKRSELNDSQVRDLWVDMERVNDQQYAYGDIKPFAEKRLKEHFRTPANRVKKRVFTEPWPLSEDFYLVSEFQDVFLVDKFRNEILLFDASTVVGPSLATRWVTPVCARDKPPVLPASTYQGERRTAAAADGTLEKATISVMNVYESDFEWPSPPPKITRLRIVQIIPKPKLPYYMSMDKPPAGYSNGGIARSSLGTVPVEDDGSAYFLAPIEREIYFQALDENGMAVQSMRSGTYVHPGEHLSCVGCHEDKWQAPMIPQTPKALRRPPSPITPDPSGSNPLNYYSLVKTPVFDKKCLPCHQRENKGPQTFDYWVANTKNLEKFRRVRPFVSGPIEEFVGYYAASWNRDDWFGPGRKDYRYFESLGLYRSTAGKVGARMCPLTSKLDPTHHNVQLTADERYRVTLWMDLNCMERGDYNPSPEARVRLLKGMAIWPVNDMDSTNPTGIQLDGTIPGGPLEN